MTRLILTTDSSSAGALQRAGLADLVIAIEHRLVRGQLPSEAELEAFFPPQTTQGRGSPRLDDAPPAPAGESGEKSLGLIELCARFDIVEFWIDPMPNAELILLWLLNHWHAKAPAAPKITMCHAGVAIGGVERHQLAEMDQLATEITRGHLELASRAWQAYRAPTPQACFGLLNEDLNLLPRLRSRLLELFEELPASVTGLGATETRMLELVAPGDVPPSELFPGHQKPNQRRVFDYWETGALLDGLARCERPALSGLDEGPFCLEMHDDPDRHQRYERSRLSLTEFGRAVLAGEADFRRDNPIDRWWGGTHLSSDRLWRWDAEGRSLVAP